jgi:NADH-quinone oxidoreductase subunit N
MITLLVFSLITSTITKSGFPKFLINWLSLSNNNLWFASLFSLGLFAIAGIPPLSGFYMKLSVIFTLIDSGFLTTSLIVVVFSCISAFYYLRLIKLVFFFKDSKQKL